MHGNSISGGELGRYNTKTFDNAQVVTSMGIALTVLQAAAPRWA